MATLITGAGMVGSRVAARMIAQGDDDIVLYDQAFSMQNLEERLPDVSAVKMVRGSITQMSEVADVVRSNGITRIIHTAAMLAPGAEERPVTTVEVNTMGTLYLLEAARQFGVERFVYCSSGFNVLGRPFDPDIPVIEDVPLGAATQYSPVIYATSKYAAEWIGHNYQDAYGIRVISMRPAGIFGPWHGLPAETPANLILRVLEAAVDGGAIKMPKAAGNLGVDWVHAGDVAQGLVLAATHPDPPSSVYNVTLGERSTLREVAQMVGKMVGRTLRFSPDDPSINSAMYAPGPIFDISKTVEELGYKPEYPIEVALKDNLDWLRATRKAR